MRNCLESKAMTDLMAIAGRADRTKFRDQVLNPLLEEGLVEMTIPDKPRSSKQRYRLTDKGRRVLGEAGLAGNHELKGMNRCQRRYAHHHTCATVGR
jgi:predicted transcriptional regulator